MPAQSPVTYNELNTLTGIDITTTIQDQLDAISGGGVLLADGHILVGNALGVGTDVAMSGDVTIVNTGATTVGNAAVIGKLLTGFSSSAGTVAATDTILQGFNKVTGNITANTSAIDALKHVVANTQTDSYTLVLADDGKIIIMNKGTANDLTVPLNASVAFPTGTQILIQQLGAGQTTVVATGGVTIQATPGLKISAQYGCATLIKTGTDTWVLSGALSA